MNGILQELAFNSLSRDHNSFLRPVGRGEQLRSFNSLSRDHMPELMSADTGLDRLSTPSLGIT